MHDFVKGVHLEGVLFDCFFEGSAVRGVRHPGHAAPCRDGGRHRDEPAGEPRRQAVLFESHGIRRRMERDDESESLLPHYSAISFTAATAASTSSDLLK